MLELLQQVPDVDAVVVAVGGGGLLAGLATVARAHGVQVVAAEPTTCCCLHEALAAGHPVDVPVASVAADSLGARRASQASLEVARTDTCQSVLVDDADIVAARQHLWDEHRLAVQHAAATAHAAAHGAST